MKSTIKRLIRWLAEPGNVSKLVPFFLIAAFSTFAGIASESVLLGIFAFPLLVLAIFLYSIPFIVAGIVIYWVILGLNEMRKYVIEWAYTN